MRTDTLIFRNYSLWFPHSRPAQPCQDLISNTAWLKTCPSRRTSDVKTELRWFWKHLALKIQLNVSLTIQNTIQIKLRWALFVTYTIIQSIMCSLHLTHPSGAVGSQRCGDRGAVGGLTSVVDTSCQSRDSNPQPWVTSGFKSNALSIRPRLPQFSAFNLSAYAPYAVGSHRTAPGELGVRCLAQGHFSRGIEFNSCRPESRTRKL